MAANLTEEEVDLDELFPPEVDPEAVHRDVERALKELANIDISIDEPEDFERVRQVLPTEPYRAELVDAALPQPLSESIEYVRPSERQSGYWRRSRDRSTPSKLSDAELEHRLAFIDEAIDSRGETGVKRTDDGRYIPRTAVEIGDNLEGEEFGPDRNEDDQRGRDIFRRVLGWF